MANITLTTSGNSHIDLSDPTTHRQAVDLADSTMPKYVGARAVVTRVENGVRIWMKDYKGETQETIAEAIQSITTNADGSLTFTLPDGRTITTGSLTGPQGVQGIQGERGIGIASIEKTGTSGLVDTYTITYDDEDTETFTVTNGHDGAQGDTGNGISSAVLNDDYTLTLNFTNGQSYTTGSIRGEQGTQGIQGQTGATGNGIASITKTASVGLVDTYTITFTDGTTMTYDVTNGANGSGSVADVWVDNVSVLDGDTAKIDLTGKANVSDLATVATSGDYDDLLDKPTIPALGKTIPYGECSTATSTVAKTVTIAGVTELTQGLTIAVKFSEANSATNPTLQVNSLTPKYIKKYGTTAPGTSSAMSWYGGSVLIMVYDGTYWQICNWDNKDTTYSSLTQSDMRTGTATTGRLITAYRLKEAILYHETGEPNVQSDWNQTDTDADDYIKSKPTIPTVNNATLTIQKNSTNVATFTANASSDVTADISVPTKVSDLTNDSGYLSSETDPVFSASASAGISSSDITAWNNKSDFSGSYDDLTNKPTIIQAQGSVLVNTTSGAITQIPLVVTGAVYNNTNDAEIDTNLGGIKIKTAGIYKICGSIYFIDATSSATATGTYIRRATNSGNYASATEVNAILADGTSIPTATKPISCAVNDVIYLAGRIMGSSGKLDGTNSSTFLCVERVG